MLDFNETPKAANLINDALNLLIDHALLKTRKASPERKYLGASRLGHPCSRALQYEYMTSCQGADNKGESTGFESSGLEPPIFSGQVLRIFAAGHLFEDLLASWVRAAGFELVTADTNGNQFGFQVAGGRVAGHIDGVIISVPKSALSGFNIDLNISCPALWEAKSMNSRSWKETVKKGLVLSKPIYAAQIALYQAYMEAEFRGISDNPCLFTAINKDTSELYCELIPFDANLAQTMSDKAVNIIKATEAGELLPRAFSSKEWFECKICPYNKRCWGTL